MKQEAYVIEKDGLIDIITSTDNDNIHDIDPLIGPLIDTDQLKETIDNDEIFNRLEQKYSSIFTFNSHKQIQTTSFAQILRRCTEIIYILIIHVHLYSTIPNLFPSLLFHVNI